MMVRTKNHFMEKYKNMVCTKFGTKTATYTVLAVKQYENVCRVLSRAPYQDGATQLP